MTSSELQRQTLQLYGELLCRRESSSGQLVLAAGAGCSATGVAAAVSIAGGCALLIDPEAAVVKSSFRQGGVDFVVNTLDEALRVLKNEIRQGRPLSVALVAAVEPTLAEMAERGVQPDLRLDANPVPSPDLAAWLAAQSWVVSEFTGESAVALRALDARLLEMLPAADRVRRAWLQRIGHYQRSAGTRVAWMTVEEEALARQ